MGDTKENVPVHSLRNRVIYSTSTFNETGNSSTTTSTYNRVVIPVTAASVTSVTSSNQNVTIPSSQDVTAGFQNITLPNQVVTIPSYQNGISSNQSVPIPSSQNVTAGFQNITFPIKW